MSHSAVDIVRQCHSASIRRKPCLEHTEVFKTAPRRLSAVPLWSQVCRRSFVNAQSARVILAHVRPSTSDSQGSPVPYHFHLCRATGEIQPPLVMSS